MPSYNHRMAQLEHKGPLIRVQLSGLYTHWIEVLGMIDTGATITTIKATLAAQLGLMPTGTAAISTVTHAWCKCFQYRVRLLFSEATVMDVRGRLPVPDWT